ncbi:hypothetical protein [Ascidiimonas aurantiaca]|uniref:hypothetical protein n=1 Tax=Ascidiimonas aurantiaca TaxID=1685432 RepID=UPI0030EE211A
MNTIFPKNRIPKLLNIGFMLVLGAMLFYGGFAKFSKPTPSPASMIEKTEKGQDLTANMEVLKIRNYIKLFFNPYI